ncbi:MAG: hypothetical protein U5L11_02655 [Arhodomonas sp.]|nr:hypothetical protein [Arhodomonas sp.]
MNTKAHRRDALAQLVAHYGGGTNVGLAKRLELGAYKMNPIHIGQLLNQKREMAEETARRIETALGLETGWMDKDPAAPDQVAESPAAYPAPPDLTTETIVHRLRSVSPKARKALLTLLEELDTQDRPARARTRPAPKNERRKKATRTPRTVGD